VSGPGRSAFEKGELSIRQTSDSFNGIWSDMGTEKFRSAQVVS
jgi:hypothetical protein